VGRGGEEVGWDGWVDRSIPLTDRPKWVAMDSFNDGIERLDD
jgi:hypothetical protein